MKRFFKGDAYIKVVVCALSFIISSPGIYRYQEHECSWKPPSTQELVLNASRSPRTNGEHEYSRKPPSTQELVLNLNPIPQEQMEDTSIA